MKSSINVLENKFYYKGEEYNKEDIKIILKNMKKRIKLNIISCNLFIKKYDLLINKDYEKFIEEKIKSDFNEKDNFLFHYERLKKENKIYLYAIRNDRFKFIYKEYEKIELNTLQFIILKYVNNKYKKNKDFIVIYNLNNKYEVINIKNNIIEDFLLFYDIESINLYIEENTKDNFIILDKSIDSSKFKKYNYIIDLKEEINEKI